MILPVHIRLKGSGKTLLTKVFAKEQPLVDRRKSRMIARREPGLAEITVRVSN